MKPTLALMFVFAIVVPGLAAETASDKPAASNQVDLELSNVSVKDAIAKLFENRDSSYFLETGVTGRIVELKLKGITFEQALKALLDAAELTYKLENGTYVIGPVKPTVVVEKPAEQPKPAASAPVEPVTTESETAQPQPVATAEPSSVAPASASSQVVINEQPSPVYYGDPGYGDYPYGYYPYPPPYSIGYVSVIPRPWSPVIVTGGGPSFIGRSMIPPPPPGWVSPDLLRFLRHRYILPTRPYYVPPYGW